MILAGTKLYLGSLAIAKAYIGSSVIFTAIAAEFSDTFTRADASTTGNGWVASQGAFPIISNQVGITLTGASTIYNLCSRLSSTADQYAEIQIKARPTSAVADPGPVVRYTNSTADGSGGNPDCYFGRYNVSAGAWQLYKATGGVSSLLGSFTETAPSLPYISRLEAVGSVITLFGNGTSKVSVTETTPLTAGRRAGFSMRWTVSGDSAQRVDNFFAGDYASAPSGGGSADLLSERIYPAATPLVNGDPWEQVQLPRKRGMLITDAIVGVTGTDIPNGTAGVKPTSAMKVRLRSFYNSTDVTSTATAAQTATGLTLTLNTGSVPVYQYEFLLNNRTQEMFYITQPVVGTTVTVVRALQGHTIPGVPVLSGDTFQVAGGDVSNSGGSYAASRAETRGDYASPSSTAPSLWPYPVNSTIFLRCKLFFPSLLFPTPTGTDWIVVTQIKGQYGGSPPTSLEVSTSGTMKLQLADGADLNFGAITRNMWHEVVLGVKLSPVHATGWAEVWWNGANVIPRFNVATMEYQSDGVTPDPIYLKQGLYKPKSWAADHTIYYGPLEVASSGVPFGAVV